jgi:hypothetical protein
LRWPASDIFVKALPKTVVRDRNAEYIRQRRSFPIFVMPGLVPGIHALCVAPKKTWMAGTSPAMTEHLRRQPKRSTI